MDQQYELCTCHCCHRQSQSKLEEVYMKTKDEMDELRASGKLKFSQMPLLEIDGFSLVESSAISFYAGRKYNLCGKTLEDEGRVLTLFHGARSFLATGVLGYHFMETPEKQEATKNGAKEKAENRYLPAFEKVLNENGSGFLVGDSPTIADCALFDTLTNIADDDNLKYLLDRWPLCQAFIKKMSEVPGIKAYLTGPRRHPGPDPSYVREVQLLLA